MTPVSSNISDATQPIQLKDSDPDPKHQDHLGVPPFRLADSCMIAPANHVTQESVNQSKTTNLEDFISNVDNGKGLQQDQRNSGEVETLFSKLTHFNKFIALLVSSYCFQDADMLFNMDSLDNLLEPTSTNGTTNFRFFIPFVLPSFLSLLKSVFFSMST